MKTDHELLKEIAEGAVLTDQHFEAMARTGATIDVLEKLKELHQEFLTNNMKEIREATKTVANMREAAQKVAIEACRSIEQAIREALQEEPFRGFKNIGTKENRLFATRVSPTNFDEKLRPGQEQLCLTTKGDLVIAFRPVDSNAVEVVPATDDDILAEDAERLVALLPILVARHVAVSKRALGQYENLLKLSEKLIRILQEV